ncbi:DSBA oxidoreductase [Thecamonas trahens ATCC 50062]|uniref:DSBA oxidoreductase n=1 Tax=Thecamonas trahens ATCC 50062 TaxID=461836 RepID=A0A0L0DA86_THETB|nr:DSBA oxidoreductase [Thecamonas trahens ATCC 50062]KNC49269.1 DSBA oxidoreductase [Thecamonas trahens ATCC 50062]|eukprot:XP_013757983.1 DSBA oxidoreductase [Thecamonas trahens ATCC 50062]
MAAKLVFYFDLACPYAYMVSHRVEAAAARCGTTVSYQPVVLGGLYKLSAAPQGKDGSASDAMSAAKVRVVRADLVRSAKRYAVPLVWNKRHPIRTLSALRALTALPDGPERGEAVHALYAAYWVKGANLADVDELAGLLAGVAPGLDVSAAIADPQVKAELTATTESLAALGAFGVPCFGLPGGSFLWGGDMLPHVERALGNTEARLTRCVPAPPQSARVRIPTLQVYVDVLSPFAYLAAQAVGAIAAETGAQVTFIPIFLSGLLKAIGTSMAARPPAKQAYALRAAETWAEWWGVELALPPGFPFSPLLALRALALEPSAFPDVSRAVWADGVDVTMTSELARVLDSAGFAGAQLVAEAASVEAKGALRANTDAAVAAGVCGVPSFTIDHVPSTLTWGQDRLDVVADMLAAASAGIDDPFVTSPL